MKCKLKRGEEPMEATSVTIYIGLERYRCSETIDGRLSVNKVSDGDSDLIKIHPRSGNEIELS